MSAPQMVLAELRIVGLVEYVLPGSDTLFVSSYGLGIAATGSSA